MRLLLSGSRQSNLEYLLARSGEHDDTAISHLVHPRRVSCAPSVAKLSALEGAGGGDSPVLRGFAATRSPPEYQPGSTSRLSHPDPPAASIRPAGRTQLIAASRDPAPLLIPHADLWWGP